ncbi:MAG: Glyceraldehyde-3-phosphate dehydrogenase, type I [Parcubacteria group bacterium GW2011_GWB1_43_8]|nr:MAG: Glyceraldehyde-3-phosphate dehydrogenase, type I [Parcubacteria group bacterium GW2011_GWB1_43_8]
MKIAINGFGRIGRVFYRQAFNHPDFEIVAINDLADKDNLLYLLEHDSVYGKFSLPEKIKDIKFLQEKDPAKLPWKDLSIDIVVESTGLFDSYDKAKAHLDAGAKRVVITAPVKDDAKRVVITAPVKDDTALTFTPNIYPKDISKSKITSNASCTTNAITPLISILAKNPGIKKAVLNTIHAYTATQGIVDKPDAKDWRRGRAGTIDISPSSTGAAISAAKAIPEMKGIFDGVAVRVPVPIGSLIDLTFISKRNTRVEEINEILTAESKKPEWQGIIKVSNEQLVSTDIIGEPYGSIVDLGFTKVIDGDLVKIFAWYDNEFGYAAMLIKHMEALKKYL